MKTMKNIEFQIPKGYIQDTAKSTPEKLVYKLAKSDNVMERITCFEDALAETGAVSPNMQILLDYNGIEEDLLAAQALVKLTIIAMVLNEGWKPNWSNQNEYKYYPWFKYDGSAFVFGGVVCDSYGASTAGASRLCFKSKELAEYAGRTFINKYKNLIL